MVRRVFRAVVGVLLFELLLFTVLAIAGPYVDMGAMAAAVLGALWRLSWYL